MIVESDRVFMTEREFKDLSDYSLSLPTGTTAGRRWRTANWFPHSRVSDQWHMGEYGAPYPAGHKQAGKVPIIWRQIIVTGIPRAWPRDVLVPLRKIERRI